MFYFIIIIIYCNFGLLEKLQEKIYSLVEVNISAERFNWNWKSYCTSTNFCRKNLSSFSLSQLLFAQIKSLYIFIAAPFWALWREISSCRVISHALWSVTLRLLRSQSPTGKLFSSPHESLALTASPLSFLTFRTVHREDINDQVSCPN